MKWIGSFLGILVGIAVIVLAAQFLGLTDFIRDSIAAGHLLDWLMGVFCFLWLLLILKAPWDLYFQAHTVAFEQQRSKERGIALTQGREVYVNTLRKRLLWFAVGAHLLSALLVVGVTYFTQGTVGYYFAAFYLVSTLFRPTLAGYAYLREKLKAVGEESRYPRHDIEEMRARLATQEETTRRLHHQTEQLAQILNTQTIAHQAEIQALQAQLQQQERQFNNTVQRLNGEFERTISRITDNQDVINGIKAFLHLVRE